CLDNLDFAPFGYQVKTAQTALRRFRGRGLLCDEVGLGKTIEAGLVLKEYLSRQLVNRVLILTPPALVEQWREELAYKFRLDDFVTTSDSEFRALGPQAWATFSHVVASLATARRAEHRREITQIVYDLVIVDEAHHLKNRASVSWKFVNALQKKYILLLTATPVQNDLDELYNLITILKPGQLKTPRQFRRQFVVQGDPRLPKNRGRLRELLADVMVRHSRSQVSVSLPPRHAHTIRLTPSPDERTLYDDVSAFVREQIGTSSSLDVGQAHPERSRGVGNLSSAQKFTLQMIQREIGSSPWAAAPTLRKLADRQEIQPYRDKLLALADRATQVESWAKADALEKLLLPMVETGAGRDGKAIIFTHFHATLERLAERLRTLGIDFVLYHGGLSLAQKDEAIRRFEESARVLLSTEAAGEGRNLQFCRTMINFDLPWNPMRIEQRVGRIHRIGQTHEVDIFNLSAEGTIEDYILDLLNRKLNMFELVIGEMDMILGQLADERGFEDLVMEVWTRARTPDEVTSGFEQLGEALVQAREAYQHTQEYDEALFGEDFTTE
ncbi:MAG: DEAD/DEAH box helicase, partial [Anaerolineae bacterium]|nr:DEAD/DEAH box helicase [Anaerolineae bacterium]